MPTSTFLARHPGTPTSTPEISTSVWLLHTWSRCGHRNEVYFSYDSALHALARRVRADWSDHSWLSGLPDTPEGLTEGAAVSLFYKLTIEEAPTVGELYDDGFEIVEHQVYGREPAGINLRMATLRVFDEHPDGPHRAALTYRLDALGLAIVLTAEMHGPVVAISNDHLPSGTAVTVVADDFEDCAQ
jgi:hypothetical protein